MLKLLRARPAIGAVFRIGGTICVARGFISSNAVSCQQEKVPLKFSKEDLANRTLEGQARIKEQQRLELEAVLNNVETAMTYQLDRCVEAYGKASLVQGEDKLTYTFHLAFTSRLSDEQICKKMTEIVKKELPLRLPGVNFTITVDDTNTIVIVKLSWK